MKKYLQHLRNISSVRFVIELGLLAYFIKVPAGIVGALIMQGMGIRDPLFLSTQQEPLLTATDTMFAVIVAPVFETLVAQFVPIEVASRFAQRHGLVIIISAVVFMLMHFPVLEFFPSAFMIGLILGWAWMVKREEGLVRVFIMVTLIHALHNVLVTLTAAMFL